MHVEYLRYFYEVATARSISKVANNSHISQPALSQQIQRLEESVGHKLLIRSNKGVELTEAGQIVEKYAKNMIKAYDNMVEDLNALSENHNSIRIDSSMTLATYALPCTLYSIHEKHPEFVFNSTSNSADSVEQNVLNGACDIGFIYGKPDDPNLLYTKVGTDRLVLIASENHPIKKKIYLKDLLNYSLIMLHEKLRERKELNRGLKSLGHNINDFKISLVLDSTESVKSAVIKGYGLSFVPYISVKKEIYTKQLKEVQILDFDINYDIYLIYNKEKDMDPGLKTFIKYLKKIGEKSFC